MINGIIANAPFGIYIHGLINIFNTTSENLGFEGYFLQINDLLTIKGI